MKKIRLSIIAIILLTMSSCEVNRSGNNKFNESDIKYVKDSRTNLCIALITSWKALSATSGFGFTQVPCEDVEKFLD
jgi:hypothetical protein